MPKKPRPKPVPDVTLEEFHKLNPEARPIRPPPPPKPPER
jgi:hypothetical protein